MSRSDLHPKAGVTPYDWWEYDIVKNCSREKTPWENQIPLALVERIVKTSSNRGDLVLDTFVGSGTTGEAAIENSRRFIGIDQDEDAIHISRLRMAGDMRPEE